MSGDDAAGLDDAATLWLALVPYWTGEAAVETEFPAPDLAAFVTAACEGGYAERSGVLSGDHLWTATFWCPPARRRELLEAAVARSGRAAVLATARTIADRLRRGDFELPLAAVAEHWTDLVLDADAADAPQRFVGTVRDLCHAGRRQEALDRLMAADALLPAATEPMAEAVERAHRLVHLADRRSHDAETLEHFQRRPEWTTDLRRLLTGERADRWAMHLVGQAGVGKTTFVRYVASGGFAAENDLPELAVARVDFDHVNPGYPTRRPVQLLVEFADELAQYGTHPQGDEVLAEFYRLARTAHDVAAREPAGPAVDAAVGAAVDAFARLLATMPARILLILDTCEELAKVDSADFTERAVEVTFDLLERVHAAVPRVSVLLSGRRPLAGTGAGLRSYLTTMPALGFRKAEAIALLSRPDQGVVMPGELVEAMLALSPAPGRADPDDARYSPYDLALYRRWWAADKTITAASLRESGKPGYVQARIVNRLDTRLWPWLPAVAQLGRFDPDMLAPALPNRDNVEHVVRELARQEWIDTDTDPVSRSLILEVDAPLRGLLLEWAHTHRPTQLAEARRALGAALAERVVTDPLDRIGATHVVSALRLQSPADAAALWERLESRMTDRHDWGWMATVSARVLGCAAEPPPAGARWVDGDGLTDNPVLIAAVRATVIGVARRDGAALDLRSAWREVAGAVRGQPGDTARRVRLRAALGEFAAATGRHPAADLERLLDEADADPGRLAGAVATAVEALADQPPRRGSVRGVLNRIRRWVGMVDDPAIRVVLRLAARRLLRHPEFRGARAVIGPLGSLRLAAEDAQRVPAGQDRWADWLAPASCPTLVHLHEAREAYVHGRSLHEVPLSRWEPLAEAHLRASTDADRLLSQCLQLRLGYGMVPRERLDRLWIRDAYDPTRRPVRGVHDRVPPLFVSIAEGYLMLGDVDAAREVLAHRRATAAADRHGAPTVRAADRAMLRLARRMRDGDLVATARDRLRDDLATRGAVWAATALTHGVGPEFGRHRPGAPEWHDRWQASTVDPHAGRVTAPPPPVLDRHPPDATLAALLLADVDEAERVGADHGLDRLRSWARRGRDPYGTMVDRVPDDWPLVAARALLAAAATGEELRERREPEMPNVAPMYEALAALEIGELRGLRDPRGAGRLLEFAEDVSRSRSPMIALQAATLRALALVHAPGDAPPAAPKELALGVNAAYLRLREHLGGTLPAWEDLVESPSVPPGPWSGWWARIRAAVAGLAELTGDPVAASDPAGRAGVPVELHPGPFAAAARTAGWDVPGSAAGADSPAPGGPVQRTAAGGLASRVLAATVRPAGVSHLTVTVRPRPRQLEVRMDRLPSAWRTTRPGGIQRGLRWMLELRAVVVPMAAQDVVPTFPASVLAALTAGDPHRVVGRLRVPRNDQVRFWESEIDDRLRDVAAPRPVWYREWPGPDAPREPGRPARVTHLVGRPDPHGFAAADPVPRLFRPNELAAGAPDLVVLQAVDAFGPAEGFAALRVALYTMAAGAAAVLLAPALPAGPADRWAARVARLDGTATPPTAADLVDLAGTARDEAANEAPPTVLFIREDVVR